MKPMINSLDQPVGRAVTRSSLEREVGDSNLRPIKSNTVLPTICNHCNICSKESVLPGRNDAEMGSANSLHALAKYCKYNERFDLINSPRHSVSGSTFVSYSSSMNVKRQLKNRRLITCRDKIVTEY